MIIWPYYLSECKCTKTYLSLKWMYYRCTYIHRWMTHRSCLKGIRIVLPSSRKNCHFRFEDLLLSFSVFTRLTFKIQWEMEETGKHQEQIRCKSGRLYVIKFTNIMYRNEERERLRFLWLIFSVPNDQWNLCFEFVINRFMYGYRFMLVSSLYYIGSK